MIQTAQNHTQIQNNMLHPSKHYQMHPQLTAGTPRGPPGPPRGAQGPPKKVKKSSTIVNDIQLNSSFGDPWVALGGPGASWQLTEGAFGNILKGVAYCFVLECDFGQFESWVNPYQLWNLN